MGNIWGFLLQTLSVSLVASILLLLKRIFEDKLSPRWQYGIWGLLALRMLLPVGVRRYIVLPLPLWMEVLKTRVEVYFHSAYSSVYQGISVSHVFPWIEKVPVSITDVLFCLYAMGVLFVLIQYAVVYARLRLLLKEGQPASHDLTDKICQVAKDYSLKECPAVMVPGISSPFVCGVISPVMVVPKQTMPDDKVILHELLHLRYGDALQSVIWCVLRALHWCNPFLQYVHGQIVADMESLCDQRVLERLEGEERREYGGLLLNMANEAYASIPGTTSLSNGGKQIAKRIAAIVRFKKYPKGMALVSICIAILLMGPFLIGTTTAYGSDFYQPGPRRELAAAMSVSRLNRCTTVAGALDTYAKGLILENGIYIASASSLSRQQELTQKMWQSSREGWVAYHLESGDEFDYIDASGGYTIWNLVEEKDGSYSALLAFPVKYFPGTESETLYWEDLRQSYVPYNVTLVVPVTVHFEDAWVVEETGNRICSNQWYRNCDDGERFGEAYRSAIPFLQKLTGEGKTGSAWVGQRVCYQVKNSGYVFDFFGTDHSTDFTPRVDAEFEYITVWSVMEYSHDTRKVEQGPVTSYECNFLVDSVEEHYVRKLDTYRSNLDEYPWECVVREMYFAEADEMEMVQSYQLPARCELEVVWDGVTVDRIPMEDAYE